MHQDKPGFTFQSMQYNETWGRLHIMYVMHDESFLPDMLNMSILQEVDTMVDMYKTLCDIVPLRFSSSLLFHSLFGTYMQPNFGTFSKHVNSKG